MASAGFIGLGTERHRRRRSTTALSPILALFANGNSGFHIPTSDPSYLYGADGAPVSDGDPIAYAIDASDVSEKPELATNGRFDTDLSDWYNPTGHWIWENGTARHPSNAAFSMLMLDVSSVAGRDIQTAFDVLGYGGSAGLRVHFRDVNENIITTVVPFSSVVASDNPAITQDGSYDWTGSVPADAVWLAFARDLSATAGEFSVDNISVREVGAYGPEITDQGIFGETFGPIDGGSDPTGEYKPIIGDLSAGGGLVTILNDHPTSPTGRIVSDDDLVEADKTYALNVNVSSFAGGTTGCRVRLGTDSAGNGPTIESPLINQTGLSTFLITIPATLDGGAKLCFINVGGASEGGTDGTVYAGWSLKEITGDLAVQPTLANQPTYDATAKAIALNGSQNLPIPDLSGLTNDMTFLAMVRRTGGTSGTIAGAGSVNTNYFGRFSQGAVDFNVTAGAGAPIYNIDGISQLSLTRGDLFNALPLDQDVILCVTGIDATSETDWADIFTLGARGGGGSPINAKFGHPTLTSNTDTVAIEAAKQWLANKYSITLPETQTITLSHASTTDIAFTRLDTADGSPITINWADGSSEAIASGAGASRTYSGATAGDVSLVTTADLTRFEATQPDWTFSVDALPDTIQNITINNSLQTINGDISGRWPDITFLRIIGNQSTIFSADLAGSYPASSFVDLRGAQMDIQSTGFIGSSTSMNTLRIWASLTTASVDAILNAAATVPTWTNAQLLDLQGNNNEPRSAASDAAVATLEGLGVTVLVDEVVQLVNPIADTSIEQNAGDFTVDLRTVFSGAISYAASGTGASIDGDGFTLRVTDDALLTDEAITATASGATPDVQDVFLISVTANAATVPAQMAAPTLEAISDTEITITLAADPDDGGSPITSRGYRYSPDGTNWTFMGAIVSPATLADLTKNTSYFVQTRVSNAVGPGAWSASAQVTTFELVELVSPIADVTITQNAGDATINLDTVFDGAEGYSVAGSSASIDVDGVTLRLSDNAVLSGEVIKVTATGETPDVQDVFSFTVTAAATAPGQMAAPTLDVVSATRIIVTLAADPSDGGSPILGYDARYSVDETSWTQVDDVISPVAVDVLTPDTGYFVQSRAYTAVGAGPWSPSAQATTNDLVELVSPIADVTITQNAGDTTIDLETVFDGATGYSVTGAGASIDGDGVTLRLSDDAVLSGETITVTATGATPDVQDVFSFSVTAAATAPAQMAAPSLVVDSATQITVTLAADPSDGGSAILGYDARYSVDETNWTQIDAVTSPFAQNGLTSATGYFFESRAYNAVGAGAWSASAQATTDVASGGAPVINDPGVIAPGTYKVGDLILPSAPDVTGADSVTFLWQRNGPAISGATNEGYVVTQEDIGQNLRRRCIAMNANDTTVVSTNPVTPVVFEQQAAFSSIFKRSDITITNGNAVSVATNVDSGVHLDKPILSGKAYFEVVIPASANGRAWVGLTRMGYGNGKIEPGNTNLAKKDRHLICRKDRGVAGPSGSAGSNAGPAVNNAGDVWYVAFDADAKLAWFGTESAGWVGDPVAGTGGFDMVNLVPVVPALSPRHASQAQFVLRSLEADFTGTVPAGFTPLAQAETMANETAAPKKSEQGREAHGINGKLSFRKDQNGSFPPTPWPLERRDWRKEMVDLKFTSMRTLVGTSSDAHADLLSLYNRTGVKVVARLVSKTTINGNFPSFPVADIDEILLKHETESGFEILAGVEGANEVDDGKNYSGWAAATVLSQQYVWDAMKARPAIANLPIGGPSIWKRNYTSALALVAAGITQYCDVVVPHIYAGNDNPRLSSIATGSSNNNLTVTPTHIKDVFPSAAIMGPPGAEFWVTETGPENESNLFGQSLGDRSMVPEDTAAKYYLRDLFSMFQFGADRVFMYALFDNNLQSTKNTYGLMSWPNDQNAVKRPTYYAAQRINTLMKNLGDFTPTPLRMGLTGNLSEVGYQLYQHSEDTYLLMIWQAVQTFNTVDLVNVAFPDKTIQLQLEKTAAKIRKYEPSVDASVTEVATNTNSLALTVPDHVVVYEIAFGDSVAAPSYGLSVDIDKMIERGDLIPSGTIGGTSGNKSTVFSMDFDGLDGSSGGMIFKTGNGSIGAYAGFAANGDFRVRCGRANGALPYNEAAYLIVPAAEAPSGKGTLEVEFKPGANELRAWWNGRPLGTPVARQLNTGYWTAGGSSSQGAYLTAPADAVPVGEISTPVPYTTASDLRFYADASVPAALL